MGKKIIAHHTLLACNGPGTAPKERTRTEVMVGDVFWAKGYLLPGWPAKAISSADRKLDEPPKDKVSQRN